jgi:hypothetical protein
MSVSARWLLVAAVASVPVTLLAQAPPLGSEFRVNTYTTGKQYLRPGVASRGDGSFVVVWTSREDQDGSGTGVFGQRFDSSGSKVGVEFQVNTYTTSLQFGPEVAVDGSGNFVVVWNSYEQDGSKFGVFGQRFDSSGAKIGSEFQANSYTTADQTGPSTASDGPGNFVVLWHSLGDGSGLGVFGQRFDSSGAKVGAEFQVNSYTSDNQGNPSVEMDSAGNFVVVWTASGSRRGVFGQFFDSSGAKVGAEFQVSADTTNDESQPAVARARNGNFMVVWTRTDASSQEVFGQRLDRSGKRIGAEIPINTHTTGFQSQPSIAVDTSGNFVVAWSDLEGSSSNIFGQRFDRSGARVGSEFQVNTDTTGFQGSPKIIDDGLGFVAVWAGSGSDDPVGIFARRQRLYPFALAVDSNSRSGTASDQNGVLEPGETGLVETSWFNVGAGSFASLAGTASSLFGPSGHYFLNDAAAGYGALPQGALVGCNDGSSDACYAVTIGGPFRPATHWDANLQEDLSVGGTQYWKLHLGDSFGDVPRTQPFYAKIETLLHHGITSGCQTAQYCPGDPVPRDQMAIFIAKGLAGSGENVPATGTVLFPGLPFSSPYNCSPGGASLFFDILPSDVFCKHVHYLAAQNVTLGCGGFKFCPGSTVTRDAMASFIAKAVVAPQGGAGVPETFSQSGRSYSCNAASPNIHFTDVPASHPFCKHIHFLWAKGIVSGCSATQYCPGDPVNRDAMAKFIANGFALQLYGP